jgi:hypothetical protein
MWSFQVAIIFLDGSFALPPSWRASFNVSSSDICDKNWEKHDDVRSISRMNMVDLYWFRPSHRVKALRPVFAVLCYEN